MASLPLHSNKLRFLKLGEMAADCGQAKTSLLGKLGHRECWAGDQRRQHVGARRIADQSGDARDVRAFLHSLIYTELCASCQRANMGVDRLHK